MVDYNTICGVGFCVSAVFALAIFAAAALTALNPRKDTANILNVGGQYTEFLQAVDALKTRYSLDQAASPESLTQLIASCTGKRSLTMLSGKVADYDMQFSVTLAGDSLISRVEMFGDFNDPIDVTTKSLLHVSGLGMDLRYVGGKQINFGEVTVRPEFEKDSEKTRQKLTPEIIYEIKNLIRMRPDKMNLSPQIGEFYDKKITIYKNRAVLTDYGLPRDPDYLKNLTEDFLEFLQKWRN